MIRHRRLTPDNLAAWLVAQVIPPSTNGNYRLRLWRENRACLDKIRDELKAYIEEAFDDARRRVRRGFEDSLSPFNDPTTDPAANYPALLHHITLQGYFGETLAVLAVEHWGAHSHTDWCVPAFLFRLHDVEFQHLESINERLVSGGTYEPDEGAERRPGRTGDDGIAFRLNNENTITDVLTIESKCVARNNNKKIKEAHEKLAAGTLRPSGVRELINILNEYDTPDTEKWVEALLKLWKDSYRVANRNDAISYTCGTIPIRGGRMAWLPVTEPHSAYTVPRRLEGMEFQVGDLPTLINSLYR
jgi:hypothetical protein